MFTDKTERDSLNKFILMRHVISHNSGFMDEKYVKERGLSSESLGAIIGIKEDRMVEFLNLIETITIKLSEKITDIVFKDLKKAEKKELDN